VVRGLPYAFVINNNTDLSLIPFLIVLIPLFPAFYIKLKS
jgi:hypothetical protein